MAPTRYLITSKSHGSDCGSEFNDMDLIDNLEQATISRVAVGHDTYIRSLQVSYTAGAKPAVRHGESCGEVNEVTLEPDEYITMIQGSARDNVIGHLTFTTNKRSYGPYGEEKTPIFTLKATKVVPSGRAPRMGLLYLSGRANSNYICRLQATFAEHLVRRKLIKLVKYEKQIPVEPSVKAPDLLSGFAKQLMSPMVRLRVGPESTEFGAYEGMLCQLPFFRAALQGQFREASEKIISMPEDEPGIISALIEFLYIGRYTYTYNSTGASSADSSEDSDTPTSDVAQGSFHAKAYAVASKYDCQQLADTALRNFKCVLNELNGIDVVRLLKEAYAKDLLLPELECDEDLGEFKQGLPELVRVLYTTHREEMQSMIADYPILGSDLLCLVARGGVT